MTTPDSRQPLGGRYQLGEVLGYGGMAEVFRGRDIRLGRDVAVKILRADLARDPSFQARFRREAQAAAQLNHPSIVSIYDTGEEELPGSGTRVPFIVMEYVAGRTLREVLQAEGRVLPRRALEIVAEVAAALEYSHRAGIVHRDIKPGNVMLCPDGAVKVMDFGIARAVTSMTATMTSTAAVMGTAQYLSPEQARGEAVDARSDIYSSGCLLYELLLGVPPFRGDSPVAVAYQHVSEDPVVPSTLDPELGPDVDAVVLKAMAKNPSNRYSTAAEFREDLLRAADGRPVLATPVLGGPATTAITTVAATAAAEPPARRHTAGWLILLAAFVAALLFGGFALKSLLSSSTHGKVNTPNLIGLTLDRARQVLSAQGLALGKVTDRFLLRGESAPAGTIFIQNPQYPFLDDKGAKVDVTVSQGIPRVAIPGDLVGKPLTSVRAELAALGLDVGSVTKQDNVNADPNTVLASTPGRGTQVDAYTTVDLLVASGIIDLPTVVNEDYVKATQQLRQAGFAVRLSYVADAIHPAGLVVGQDPSGPGLLQRGTVITLTVAQTPTATPSASPSDSTSPSPSASASGSPSASPSGSPSPTP